MSPIPDEDIHNIVERVVKQTLGNLSMDSRTEGIKPQTPSTPKTDTPLIKPQTNGKKVAIGSDHGGFEMKEALKADLLAQGYNVIDCGTNSKEAVDYPDFALAVALKVADGSVWRGVVIDGAGIGSCMAANKVPGVRAAMCYDYATASNSREHNDANVLTLGAGLIGLNQAKLILKTWLSTEFGGARHQKRIDKIIAIEKQFLKDRK
jgi:ribose 5-phosphate isomerase B